MMHLLIIIYMFSYVFSYVFIPRPYHTRYRYIEDLHVVQLGEYTNLICILNSDYYVYTKNFQNWMKQIKYSFVFNSNGRIVHLNNEKYKGYTFDNTFILQIKNMTNDDMKKYKFKPCVYKRDNKFLKLNTLNFTYPLSPNNINITYILPYIYINFNKIYPTPNCFLKINNISIFPENIIKIEKINFIYDKVNLSMQIENKYCFKESKIEIICNLLNQEFTIDLKNETCSPIYYEINDSSITIFEILLLIYDIILVIFIYLDEKNKNFL